MSPATSRTALVLALGAAATIAAPACSGGGGGDDDGASDDAAGDDGAVSDSGVDAPADAADIDTCPDPDNCAWLDGYLASVLGKLTGVEPTESGVTITRRATQFQRNTVRQYLMAELSSIGLSPTLHSYGSGSNVVVQLPSTTGSTLPRIVIGAHFDGVPAGPAASDNGTGTAIVVTAARYLASRPIRARAIDIVLFDQEEVGLIGSSAYALKLRNDMTPVDSVHSFDMISYDGDGDGTLELWKPHADLEQLYREHAEARGIPIAVDPQFESSDHDSFATRGFVTVGVSEEFSGGDYNPNYHLVTDTYDNVQLPYTLRMTRLILTVLEDRSRD